MTTMANTTLEEGELEQSICSVVENSWYEECEQADHEMTNRCSAPGMVAATTDSTTVTSTAAAAVATAISIDNDDSFLATKDTSNTSSCSGSEHSTSSGDREILVSFLDVSNELKFDRLLEKKKIKTTFKRCLSPTSALESVSDSKRPSATAANTAAAAEVQANDENDDDADAVIGRRKPRDESLDSSERSSSSADKPIREFETDVGILERRQKQIDYGKNTVGYDEYMKQVPKEKRTTDHPWTPQKSYKYSRRAFDGLVKIWRKKLHCYDPSNMNYAGAHHENAGKSV